MGSNSYRFTDKAKTDIDAIFIAKTESIIYYAMDINQIRFEEEASSGALLFSLEDITSRRKETNLFE